AQAKPADRLAFLLYFGATLAPRLATLASMLVLTRVLPVAEYGLFVLVVVTGEILESTTTTWIRLLLLRTEAGRGAARPRALRRHALEPDGSACEAPWRSEPPSSCRSWSSSRFARPANTPLRRCSASRPSGCSPPPRAWRSSRWNSSRARSTPTLIPCCSDVM